MTEPCMKVNLAGVELKNPVVVASGTFGFGREYGQFYDLSELGGICVKGLTAQRREGNPAPRIAETPMGILNSVGLQNPGVDAFIAEELPFHVYDITYGSLVPYADNLVIIDDSIVRGTTLKQSIISILDRLHPKKIVIVSSSPQVRYPDYYGIDMASMEQFIAFKAAIALLEERGMQDIIINAYSKSKAQLGLPKEEMVNYVKEIYAPFTDEEISAKMVELLTPVGTQAKVEIVYQTLEGLHEACPDHTGDWYFSGDYPTPGGVKLVNQAFINKTVT